MPVKRRDLVRRIAAQANTLAISWQLLRRGANHDLYALDELPIPIPRHTEIGEALAEVIFKECEPKLGRRWWK